LTKARQALQPNGNGNDEWILAGDWNLIPGAQGERGWRGDLACQFITHTIGGPATVPGTVLTTMIDRGVYPDPDYGLNNLAIPESLNKQDYWYRVEFRAPKSGRRPTTDTHL